MNRWFKWEPGTDTLMAVGSDVAMWAIYYANSHMVPATKIVWWSSL